MSVFSRSLRRGSFSLLLILLLAMLTSLLFPLRTAAQAGSKTPVPAQTATQPRRDAITGKTVAPRQESPTANPGRPTVSTPATLSPVGYLQFETGLLAAWHSPEFSSQQSLGEVTKLTVLRRLELLAGVGPYVHSDTQPHSGTGDIILGAQAVIHPGEGPHPTFALSYFRDVFSGGTPDLDIGSAKNSVLLLASADVKGFHYDTNCIFNEQVSDRGIRRAQFGQTLSVSHGIGERFGISGEIWHFTQPLVRGNAIGNLWAVNYNARKNLVFDSALDRGLTATSTRWEFLAGFTYLLPHKIHF